MTPWVAPGSSSLVTRRSTTQGSVAFLFNELKDTVAEKQLITLRAAGQIYLEWWPMDDPGPLTACTVLSPTSYQSCLLRNLLSSLQINR